MQCYEPCEVVLEGQQPCVLLKMVFAHVIRRCNVCAMRQSLSTKAPLKPTICTIFVQIDLIDMRKNQFEEYTWLLSLKDRLMKSMTSGAGIP